jgi:thiol-disulfide isomerase/thioredoxin
VRTDPGKGEEIRNSPTWRKSDQKAVEDLKRETWGKNSLSGKETNRLFLSSQAKSFADISALAGVNHRGDGRAVVLWDYDRDGWQDLSVINANFPTLVLYRNNIAKLEGRAPGSGQVLALRFVGGNRESEPSKEYSCRDGFGVSVKIELDGRSLFREHRCGEGFSAQNSATMLFGIGNNRTAKSVLVRWPTGKTQSIADVPAGTLLTVYENLSESGDGAGFKRTSYVGSTVDYEAKREQRRARGLTLKLNHLRRPPGDGAPRIRMYTLMATWCVNCKKELPQISYLKSQFQTSEVGIFGLPFDENDDVDKLRTYVTANKPAYRLVPRLTEEERLSVRTVLSRTLRQEALPATIVTDARGRVLRSFLGVPNCSDLRRILANFP